MGLPNGFETDPFDLDGLERMLSSSSTKKRRVALSSLNRKLLDPDHPVEVSLDLATRLANILFQTYPYYIDRDSRKAVQKILQADCFYPPLNPRLVSLFESESRRAGIAASNAFVLVEWGAQLLQQFTERGRDVFDRYSTPILQAQARFLELILDPQLGARPSLRKSAITITRRAVRNVVSQLGGGGLEVGVQNLTAKGQALGNKSAILLGIIAGVYSHHKARDRAVLPRRDQFYSFYQREILGSRAPVPSHIASAFNDFFASFTTLEELEADIIPQLEKALLRAPEVVLKNVMTPLFTSLPPSIDLASVLATSLCKVLLSSLKSSNHEVRDGAVKAFSTLITRSQAEEPLWKVTEDVLVPMTSSKLTADHRVLYSRILVMLPPILSRSEHICESLCPAIAKETNEIALSNEVTTLLKNFGNLSAPKEQLVKIVLGTCTKGLDEKRPSLRRQWILGLGDVFWNQDGSSVPSKTILQLEEACFKHLVKISDEVAQNPVTAASSGLAVGALITIALSQKLPSTASETLKLEVRRSNSLSKVLSDASPTSIVLGHRVYTKLTEVDLLWHIRSLQICSEAIRYHDNNELRLMWSHAFIYLISAADVDRNVRSQAVRVLSAMYLQEPSYISSLMINGLWSWYKHKRENAKDIAAVASKAEHSHLLDVLRAICIPAGYGNGAVVTADDSGYEDQVISMLILCRSEIIPGANWIELCLRMGQDPGKVASRTGLRCVQEIERCLMANEKEGSFEGIRLASYKAAADLAFVAPVVITPLLVESILTNLPNNDMAQCGLTEIAIAKMPEGTAFIDVLSNQNQRYVIDKNARDYETMKWEEEVRNQLAQKKGKERKLTADEKAKVDAQLIKEADIRRKVKELEQKLRNGIGYIHALGVGPPNEADVWLGPSLRALTNVIEAGAARLVGSAANEAYLACSKLLSSRIAPMKEFVGVATLRTLGSSLSSNMQQEPLKDQVTRILHRLHFLGEQRPFDNVSLHYILPLVALVILRGGIAHSSDEEADEQLTLVLEILSYHVDNFSDPRLPRSEFLRILIDALQLYPQHFRALKDLFGDLCRVIGPSISLQEEVPVLLKGTLVKQSSVRNTILQAIRDDVDLTDFDFCEEIWLSCHDDDSENAAIGHLIWKENALESQASDAARMLSYLGSKDQQLRRAAARALASCVGNDRVNFRAILTQLEETYQELTKPRLPELDAFGMPKKVDPTDPWEHRSGIALAFKELATAFDNSLLILFITYLIKSGALSDNNLQVRTEMTDSATRLVALHGGSHIEELMQLFKSALDQSETSVDASDSVGEAVVILYGALAQHLSPGDDRVPQVVRRLILTLSTPSENVQYAVADCMPPLIRNSADKVSEYIQLVMDQLLTSKKFATRRGAAYGLAGIVKGKGVSALHEYRLLSKLKGATEAKKDANQRQGALLAYELLASLLGRIFEPYIIQILPQLLSSFGDANADVREACLDASKSCFAHLSSYGVKIILPTLLEGLEETQWRSKKGACDLLGAMAYLDPQQLAMSLPDIIPPLTNVLNDSHKEVRAAANRSLQRFGEVISNPEVKSLVNILLKALSDPTKYTDDALDALIKVSFVHYLDSPSLALIVRILQRGLGDRSATKRKSSQIIGSLAHLTDRKDITPHLPILVSGLKFAIVDPVPATRATASKALGSLVEKLGEAALPDLIPNLMSTLKSDTGAGDRLGSAQALSEVLAGLGTGRLEETLPSILQNAASVKAAVREGFMSLFIYLPACFGNSFAGYLSKIIPPILAGLADEMESIRETALKAGRLLVKNFATKAIDLLLPELDRGLANDSYRIRLSSVELVGDLLFSLTGISGTAEQDEEEGTEAAEAGQSLLEVLGEEKRNKILSSLYICRYDTSGLVRSAAINVWKALVATPRTLKELVPTLTHLLIQRLASSNMEHKVIAGNALGELIRKAGEGVLSSLLPTLETGLQTSTDSDSKQGICIALREIISSASPETLEDYESTLISVVRVALADPDVEVREAAAEAFDSLQRIMGKKAVDQVLPPLLNLLRTEGEAETALSALLTLLTDNTRSNIILPNLVPTLMASPITSFNAKAIASLSQVAGPAMTRRLSTILNGLMDNIVMHRDTQQRGDLEDAFDTILLSVDEFDGLNTIMSIMLALVKNEDHRKRAVADMRLSKFLAKATVDFSRYHQDLIRVLLISFDDSDPEVVKAAWVALSELTQRLKKEEMESLVLWTRQILQQVGVPGVNLPGFLLPKGINAILPIFLQGLMNGTAEQRTSAALGISDIIDRSNADALKLSVTQITGPLIRVVSERSVDVKAAILLTLNNLLQKIPTFLKPFLPQLQRTFAKSLADTSSELLRSRAAKALGTLITLTPRIDPLIAELVTGSKTADAGVQNAMLRALHEVLSKAGNNMSEASRTSVLSLIDGDIANADDAMAITSAKLLGALVKCLPSNFNPSALLKARVLTSPLTKISVLNLNAVLVESPGTLMTAFPQETASAVCQGIASGNPFIMENSILAAGKYMLFEGTGLEMESNQQLLAALANVIPPGNPIDARRLALVVIRTIARIRAELIKPSLEILSPPVFASVRDTIIPVKLAAEAAFLAIFSVVEEESEIFDKYMAKSGSTLNAGMKRSMQDYFKRVALRLGSQARERREAEGGQGGLGLSNDERDDEKEVWSVGKVDLGEGTFSE